MELLTDLLGKYPASCAEEGLSGRLAESHAQGKPSSPRSLRAFVHFASYFTTYLISFGPLVFLPLPLSASLHVSAVITKCIFATTHAKSTDIPAFAVRTDLPRASFRFLRTFLGSRAELFSSARSSYHDDDGSCIRTSPSHFYDQCVHRIHFTLGQPVTVTTILRIMVTYVFVQD